MDNTRFDRAESMEILLRIWEVASGRCRCEKVDGEVECKSCRARGYRRHLAAEMRRALLDLNRVDMIKQVPR